MTTTPDTEKPDPAPLPMLEKRRIEAAIIKNVYDVLAERHGEAEAEAVISKAVFSLPLNRARSFAGNMARNRACSILPLCQTCGKWAGH